jgi:tRNA dimethylallyltransferase
LPQPTPELVLISGPTASGKSGLALRLCQEVGGEIIGGDSVQIYKHLDIGSAKASAQDRALVPHHLVDALELDAPYDAGHFARQAEALIAQIQGRGALPVVCGGTGLYLRALLYGVAPAPPTDPALRAQLQGRFDAEGGQALHDELRAVDPAFAQKIHPNDAVRVVRGLEYWHLTGQPLGQVQAEHNVKERQPRYRALHVALGPPRERLYERINQRVDEMMQQGFLEEVRGLLDQGHAPGLKPLGSLGYRQLIAHLRGDVTLEEAVRQIKRDHRRYAKRQMTWLRGQANVRWFEDPQQALAHLRQRFTPPTQTE